MTFGILRDSFRHPLHSRANQGMVISEFSGEIKHFPTREDAASYSKLSGFRLARIKELR